MIYLQPTTPSDPTKGYDLQVSPVGHTESLGESSTNLDYASKKGVAIQIAEYITAQFHDDEKNGEGMIFYGKSGTPENSLPHVHYKVTHFSGDVAQPFPTDAGWEKKETQGSSIDSYVRAKPVSKRLLSAHRYDQVRDKLLELIDQYITKIQK